MICYLPSLVFYGTKKYRVGYFFGGKMKRTAMGKLLEWKASSERKPLILQGARQVGKTWLLKEFGEKNFRALHILNFEKQPSFAKIFAENLSPKVIISELELLLKKEIVPESDLIVFDEIQEVPRALTSLKYFAEESPHCFVAAAGSLLGLHLASASFPVGKVEMLELFPLSFDEFLDGIGEHMLVDSLKRLSSGPLPRNCEISEAAHGAFWEHFKNYLVVGGMPEAVSIFAKQRTNSLHAAFRAARDKQELLVKAYFSDIAKHSGKVNAMHVERVLRSVPAQMAAGVETQLPKYVFKDVIPGMRGYERMAPAIDWLQKAGLILRLPIANSGELPFLAHSSENFFKLALFDVGILGALVGLPPQAILQYSFGSYKGYFAENFVLQQFFAAGLQNLVCWREGTSEVEFLTVSEQGAVIPIEVKAGLKTKAKSLTTFRQRYMPPYSLLLSGVLGRHEQNGVCRWPIYAAGMIRFG